MLKILDTIKIQNKDTGTWVCISVVVNINRPLRDQYTIIQDMLMAGFLVLPICYLKPT